MQQHEKTSLRYVFFRLYSNDELLDFLKEQLKNGLVLDHCKGNFFFFTNFLCMIVIFILQEETGRKQRSRPVI